ncbi:T9SS type A sorting domain-containing protein [Pontibacter cellulosilyticus]|uniref:T9SS type A sorting domain-containing protein n=1 Tax=Pontibacter cellulosilyticus TaxID=1720253 RepID=A0A923N8N9_9BACT|nr:T9SS type A sorting domain-containing protein [Pontibacter cellulosilyticus]MBC5994950.1 T9SS type A sorting domain-containing protein [Pontibacter cellulosilyticus]
MKKMFTLLLFTAALLACPLLQAQDLSALFNAPSFKAPLKSSSKLTATDNARLAVAQAIRVAQTEVYSTWSETNQWEEKIRTNITYNSRGLKETVTVISLPDNINLSQYTYTYNSLGQSTEMLLKTWQNNAWVNSMKMTLEMEGESLKNFGIYNWTNGAWVMSVGMRSTNTRTNGQLTETVTESYVLLPAPAVSAWTLDEKMVYTYNGSDNRPVSITTYNHSNNAWVLVEKETNIAYVGSTSERSSYYLEELDTMLNTWSKYKYEYVYTPDAANGTRTVVETEFYVEGSTHTPHLRYTTKEITTGEAYLSTFTFGTLEEIYDDETDLWVRSNEEKAIITKDGSGSITEIVVQEYTPLSAAFVNKERYLYSNFTTLTVTGTADDALAQATEVYPNPVQNTLRISLDAAKVRNATVNIYSITGQKVYEQSRLAATTTVDVSTLPAGVYMVKIADDKNASVVRRIVKQ